MPVTDQDARALAYLAIRLRVETNATTWDEAGTLAATQQLVGRGLHPSIERVARHAADPQARTPAAIHRPFLPDAPGPEAPSNPKPHEACTTCGRHIDRCICEQPSRRKDHAPAPDLSATRERIRVAREARKPTPEGDPHE
ncbi:hypothetical protein [Nocardioides alcanivorans]|uniref:hypothetical protein n=1 Tax=Nocardioides alcanivorans TaxID=2897352 RepID=UPI001F3879A3|nr:hypothetical protein [Nocardioides alcanivorans]